jgi:diaminopimelate decarboxylase
MSTSLVMALAASFGMKVTQIHFHFGSGYLTRDLPQLELALESAEWFIERCPHVDTLDIGGGTSDFTIVRLSPSQLGRSDRTRPA